MIINQAFWKGESDSISVHLKKARSYFNHPIANLKTSAFGHPTQNNSSHALRELFGVNKPSDHGDSTPSRKVERSKGTNFGQNE